jgi:2',3'-cyclic-nucleotide 2'-phosphodiesterase (5'-nucleotidase family)
MIDLFNHLKYDAWVIGNHEFDCVALRFLGDEALTQDTSGLHNTSV